jgi:hypothetical protein
MSALSSCACQLGVEAQAITSLGRLPRRIEYASTAPRTMSPNASNTLREAYSLVSLFPRTSITHSYASGCRRWRTRAARRSLRARAPGPWSSAFVGSASPADTTRHRVPETRARGGASGAGGCRAAPFMHCHFWARFAIVVSYLKRETQYAGKITLYKISTSRLKLGPCGPRVFG